MGYYPFTLYPNVKGDYTNDLYPFFVSCYTLLYQYRPNEVYQDEPSAILVPG